MRERYLEFLAHWPVPHERLLVPTREGETFVIASGPQDAAPLLLLHGSAFNSLMWMGDVAAWSERFRVYAVDVIGQPGLSAPSRPPYDSEAYALWLDDVSNALPSSARPVAIAGISLGGWLALDYATRRSERVARLVLFCPGGVGRAKTSMFRLLFVIMPLLSMGRWGRRKAMTLMLGPAPADRSPAAAAVAEFAALIFKHFRPNTRPVTLFDDAALRRLTMPVLLIVGDRDNMVDSGETRQRLERHAADVEVRWLTDTGHVIVGQTEPILEFLLRHAV